MSKDNVTPHQSEIEAARMGINIQFTSMFDEPTRTAMEALGIQKFIDHVVTLRANDQAWLRHYANILHPKADS